MNEEQYSRANKRVLLAIVVVFGYIAAKMCIRDRCKGSVDGMASQM